MELKAGDMRKLVRFLLVDIDIYESKNYIVSRGKYLTSPLQRDDPFGLHDCLRQ